MELLAGSRVNEPEHRRVQRLPSERAGDRVDERVARRLTVEGIAEHGDHAASGSGHDRHDRWLSIVEAVLLSLVAVLAAYSGYAAAKWSTESRWEF